MDITLLLLFCFAVIGMTHIIVDSTLFEPVRTYLQGCIPWLGKLVGCYQCCGFWCGAFLGLTVLSWNPFVIFAAGCAGSFLATLGANYLTYLEANALVSVGEPTEKASDE